MVGHRVLVTFQPFRHHPKQLVAYFCNPVVRRATVYPDIAMG